MRFFLNNKFLKSPLCVIFLIISMHSVYAERQNTDLSNESFYLKKLDGKDEYAKEEKDNSKWAINADGYHEIVNHDKTKIEMGAVLGVGLFKVKNSQYGAGSADLKNRTRIRNAPSWTEGFFTPKARFTYGFENGSEIYSRISGVAAKTWGDGDASNPSTTSDRPFLFDHEEGVLGWKSGTFTKQKDLINVSFGSQAVAIGDSLLIAEGTTDSYRRAAFYLGPRTAFRNTGVLKINSLPMRGQIFHVRSNTNQEKLMGTDHPKASLFGGNIEYVSTDPKDSNKEFWTIGMTALYIYKADRTFKTGAQANRDGLKVYSPRFGGNFFPFNRDIRFFAGYVHQQNDNVSRKTKAKAYYIEPAYTFSRIWGSPMFLYRFMHFSGDRAPGSSVKKSYDPLFFGYGVRDGMGTWETGVIQSNFYFSLTNQNVHTFQFKLTPSEEYSFGVQYFMISFDKTQQAGSVSRRAANELDAYLTWIVSKRVSLTALVGATKPRAGIKEITIQNNPGVDPSKIGKTTLFFGATASFKI